MVTIDVVRQVGRIDAIKGKETLLPSSYELRIAKTASSVGITFGFIAFLYQEAMKNMSWQVKILSGAITMVSIVARFILDDYKVGGPHMFVKWWGQAAHYVNAKRFEEGDKIDRNDINHIMSNGVFTSKNSREEVVTCPYFTMKVYSTDLSPSKAVMMMFYYDHTSRQINYTVSDFSGGISDPIQRIKGGEQRVPVPLTSLLTKPLPDFSESVRGKTRMFAPPRWEIESLVGTISQELLDTIMVDATQTNTLLKQVGE